MIEFVVASHNEEILKSNVIRSFVYRDAVFTIVRGFNNIPQAYNSVQTRKGNIVVYCHHDIFFPPTFFDQLKYAIATVPGDWGVLGVAGVKLLDGKKQNRGHISDRGNVWGSEINLPSLVQTLDEMLLITRGDILFDEQFDLHFYGADICMQANLQGRECYAINAYCEHNSGLPVGHRSQSFKDCEAKFRAKYIDHLPIVTTCTLLT